MNFEASESEVHISKFLEKLAKKHVQIFLLNELMNVLRLKWHFKQ